MKLSATTLCVKCHKCQIFHHHEILYVQCFQCLQKLSSSSSHVQSSLFTYHKSSDKPKWTHNLLSLVTFLNFLKLAGQLYKTRHGSGLPVHRGQTLLVHCLNKQIKLNNEHIWQNYNRKLVWRVINGSCFQLLINPALWPINSQLR